MHSHLNGKFSIELFYRYQRSEQALVLTMTEMVINCASTWKLEKLPKSCLGRSFLNQLSQLFILGDGDIEPWAAMAEKLGIRDKVKFCGVLPGGEPVLNWLDQMDIYIQPSFQEGLPRTVIEAMSRGCPVVGSSAGGIPELINRSSIHKPGDYKSLADCIERVILDKDYSMKLTRENLEVAKQYRKSALDHKRIEFWNLFIDECLIT